MPRNRIYYQSEALYVGPSPATGQHFNSGNSGVNYVNQLYRVQSNGYDFNIDRVDVNQKGELAAIDRVVLNSPTVSYNLSYILANFVNERYLGFVTDGSASCISGLLNKTQDEKNYFVKISSEGVDSVSDTVVNTPVVGIGNGFISSYSSQGSVGSFPTVSVNVEALNMAFEPRITGIIPAINPEDGTRVTTRHYRVPTAASEAGTGNLDISALRPGDIRLTFKSRSAVDEGSLANATGVYSAPGVDIVDAKIQSYSVDLSLSRETIQRLGSRFAFSREITFPVTASMSFEAVVGDLTTGSLNTIINCDESFDLKIELLSPTACNNTAQVVVCSYNLKNAKLNSQSYSSAIGSNQTVRLEFSAQVGGPNQQNVGLFMSGLSVTPPKETNPPV